MRGKPQILSPELSRRAVPTALKFKGARKAEESLGQTRGPSGWGPRCNRAACNL